MTSAWLAPELPSVSGTFVFREIDALRAAGYPIRTWSLHRPAADGLAPDGAAHLATTGVVYDGWRSVASRALRFAARHPLRAAATIAVAARDTIRGTFAKPGQRAKVAAQAVAGLALAGDLRRAGARHLHVHFSHSVATVGMYAARAAGIPFSVTAHANDLYVESSLLREKCRRARAFVTISEANRVWIRERTGADGDRVQVVRCGVDAESFRPSGRTSAEARILAVGRLVPKKGFDLLLRALPGILVRRPDAVVEIAGDGPELDALRRLAAELGVAKKVRFLGSVDRDRVRDLLGAAGVFVLPCRSDPSGDRDGIPVALMEAMASGVPAVSTRLSGVPELVRDGDTGVLCTPDDAGAIELAVTRVLADSRLAAGLSVRGRAFVREEYDLRRNALRLARAVGLQAPGVAACDAAARGPSRA